MTEAAKQSSFPPRLKSTESGDIDTNSLADLLEWFLNYDPKVGYMRHPFAQELFEWKQADDAAQGVKVYPFENAEARFAIGSFQAIAENNTQSLLQVWITQILEALGGAREFTTQISESYKLNGKDKSPVELAQLIPSRNEQRLYLSSCWITALCTAEARFLGWVYQERYDKPFEPATL